MPIRTNEFRSVDAKSTEEAERSTKAKAAAIIQGVVGRVVFAYSEPGSSAQRTKP